MLFWGPTEASWGHEPAFQFHRAPLQPEALQSRKAGKGEKRKSWSWYQSLQVCRQENGRQFCVRAIQRQAWLGPMGRGSVHRMAAVIQLTSARFQVPQWGSCGFPEFGAEGDAYPLIGVPPRGVEEIWALAATWISPQCSAAHTDSLGGRGRKESKGSFSRGAFSANHSVACLLASRGQEELEKTTARLPSPQPWKEKESNFCVGTWVSEDAPVISMCFPEISGMFQNVPPIYLFINLFIWPLSAWVVFSPLFFLLFCFVAFLKNLSYFLHQDHAWKTIKKST